MRVLKKKQNTGFTIIELVIVIAVMSVLMTAAIPSLDRILNESRRNMIGMNVETLNAVMEGADTGGRISFQDACTELTGMYADSATLADSNDATRFSEHLGISRKLNTAILYDSQESRWIYLRVDLPENIVDEVAEQYGQPRYFLPVRSGAEIKDYAGLGLSLGLLDDIDVLGEKKLLDEDGSLTIAGGLALNGHIIKGAKAIRLTENGATAEFLSGSVCYTNAEGDSIPADLYFGQEGRTISTACLMVGSGRDSGAYGGVSAHKLGAVLGRLAEEGDLPETPIELGNVMVRNVSELSVYGILRASTLRADDSGILLMPDSAVDVTESSAAGQIADGDAAFIHAGSLMKNGEPAAFRGFSGGMLNAESYDGDGIFYNGPIGFEVAGGMKTLTPGSIRVRPDAMEPDENGTLLLTKQDGWKAFNGALAFEVKSDGRMELASVLLDAEMRLYIPDSADEIVDSIRYTVLRTQDERSVIADRKYAILYQISRIGSLTPYCVCVDQASLAYADARNIDWMNYLAGENAGVAQNQMILFTDGDGGTLYERLIDDNGDTVYRESGYYFAWGADAVSSIRLHTVTYFLYNSEGVWIKNYASVKHGGSVMLPRPYRAGYVFSRWIDQRTDGDDEQYDSGVALVVEKDRELYAMWLPDSGLDLILKFDRSSTGQMNFEIVSDGLVFGCEEGRGCIFRNQIEIEGVRYAVCAGGDADYRLRTGTTGSQTVYEIYRRSDGAMVGSSAEPRKSDVDGGVKLTAYGHSVSITLPDPDPTAFTGWLSDTRGVTYSAGEVLTLASDGVTNELLTAQWQKRSGEDRLSLTMQTTDGRTARISNRIYQIRNGASALQSATLTLDGTEYLLAKDAVGNWMLTGSANEGENARSFSLDSLGLTDKLYYSFGTTRGTATVSVSGGNLAVTADSITCRDKTFPITDGRLSGGKLSGSIEFASGADTYVYDLSSSMNKTVSYALTQIKRGDVSYRYNPASGMVTMGDKCYAISGADQPGSSTRMLAQVRLVLDQDEYWLDVTDGTAAVTLVNEALGSHDVIYAVTDDESSAVCSLTPISVDGVSVSGTEGIIAIGNKSYTVGELIGSGAVSGGSGTGSHTHTYGFYTTVRDGVNVTEYGCTLCQTASVNRTIVLSQDVTLEKPFYVPTGAAYTLNLNGNNLIASDGDAIYNYGSLTILSDGFSFPVLETDENDNLLFTSGDMSGYVIVNNGSAATGNSNRNGIINWGTLSIRGAGVAVSDTYGNAVVNAENGFLITENAVLINTGLGNGVYANGGTTELKKGTVIWSTTYGFAVFVYNGATVTVSGGSYYSTAGFPFCLCGGRLSLKQYCVTDRSKSGAYADYVEMDGFSGEIYWLAGTLDTTNLSEARFQYPGSVYSSVGYFPFDATKKSWVFPQDFSIVVSLTMEDDEDLICEQWSTQVYIASTWTPGSDDKVDIMEQSVIETETAELVYLGNESQIVTETTIASVDGSGSYEPWGN